MQGVVLNGCMVDRSPRWSAHYLGLNYHMPYPSHIPIPREFSGEGYKSHQHSVAISSDTLKCGQRLSLKADFPDIITYIFQKQEKPGCGWLRSQTVIVE